MITTSQLKELDSNGICIIPDALPKKQTTLLRSQIVNYLKDYGIRYNGGFVKPDPIGQFEELSWIFTDTPIVSIAKEILGEDASYIHHTDIAHNTFTGWHKDVTGYDDNNKPLNYWDIIDGQGYKIFKFMIYLQDHTRDKTALRFVPNSHLNPNFYGLINRLNNFIQNKAAKPKLGSIVVFDQRLTHNGVSQFAITKPLYKFSRHDGIINNRLWKYERWLRRIQDRVFFQIAIGNKSKFSKEHAIACVNRQIEQNKLDRYKLKDTIRNKILQSGLHIFPDLDNQKNTKN